MKYTLVKLLGTGGLAEVHLVQDEHGKRWALKRLKSTVTDDKSKARFRQEIRIQASLRHAGIVPVIAADTKSDCAWYIMPLADRALDNRFEEFVTDPAKFQAVAAQLITAISYAHGQKVLHRDIKPRNVLCYGEIVRLADFGLGKAYDQNASYMTTTSDAWGTFWYASPEQRRGLSHCNMQSDIYSLGKLFFNCLVGKQLNDLPETMDSRWTYIISKCIRDDPGQRWGSISHLERQFKLVFGIDESLVVDQSNVLAHLKEYALQPTVISEKQIEELAVAVSRIGRDEVLLRRTFDSLPRGVVQRWAQYDIVGFRQLIHRVDATLEGALAFDYCDVVADQYTMIHELIDDPEIRHIIRCRIFQLGPTHNRWHVGEKLQEILCSVRDPADIAAVISLLQKYPEYTAWNSPYCRSAGIDQRIRAQFDCISGGREHT